MTEPTHSRNDVLHATGSANSRVSINQSSPATKLRKKASHLPPIQTKPGLNKRRSVCSLVESLTLTNSSEDLSENWPCEVPHSAPPVVSPEPVFVWSSPKRNPQDAVFFDWSNETATISSSSSNHQDEDCSIRMSSGNKHRRDEKSSNPYSQEFKAQSSADGATTTRRTQGQTRFSRKPPHHLPPLDPSLFKTKNKSTKADRSREKKTKHCVTDPPIEVESSNEVSSENDSKGANKMDDGFCSPPEKNALSDKQSSETSRSINQNSCPSCMYHSMDSENDDLSCHGMLQKAQRVVPCKYETRALRRCISISSSMEILSSKKMEVDARAGISDGSSIQKSRAGLRPSLQSTAFLPLLPEATSNGNISNRFSIRGKAAVIAPSRPTYEGVGVTSSKIRREENPTVPFQETPAIHTEFQHAAGIVTEEMYVVGEFPRCDPQPGPSSSNSCAYWRLRKSGVCSQVQSVAEQKERTQARVLIKRFGTLDIKKN